MEFSNETKQLIIKKIKKLKEYASWSPFSKKPPIGYGDCLTYRLSIVPHFNIEPIIDELLVDGKDGLVKRLKGLRDKALNNVKSWNRGESPDNFMQLPDNVLRDDVLALALTLERALRGQTASGGEVRDRKKSKKKLKPLSAKVAAVYELLKALPEHRGLTGREILEKLEKQNPPIIFDQSTLTKNIIPELHPYGVRNKRGAGYFINK
jgi:hypothetical protein